ncbi:MAG TPA: T9SS type A sorting domain-containing protein [Bacteroidia bacterium]|nr:T9SS type A sorting domain-containing protein [Bacteroidia bacterium]
MRTKNYIQSRLTTAIIAGILISAIAPLMAQVESPHRGLSTVVIANHYPTWQNAASICFADKQFASVALGRGQASDTIEIGNFRFNIPNDAVIEGITVTVNKGANGNSITDNTIKLVYDGTICGTDHANLQEWPLNAQAFSYGGDNDQWGLSLTPANINSYSFGIAISVANSFISLDSLKANIDYVNISVNYKRPSELGLTEFTAYFDDGEVNTDWTMASQNDCAGFAVERTVDGMNTEIVGVVTKNNNTDNSNSYSFVDKAPLFGTSYYRVVERKTDGTSQAFDWVAVSTNQKVSNVLLYPNPTGNELTVKFPSIGQSATLMVMDEKGSVVMNQTIPSFSNTDNTTYIQDVSSLPQGIYMVVVNNGEKNFTDKFVKK